MANKANKYRIDFGKTKREFGDVVAQRDIEEYISSLTPLREATFAESKRGLLKRLHEPTPDEKLLQMDIAYGQKELEDLRNPFIPEHKTIIVGFMKLSSGDITEIINLVDYESPRRFREAADSYSLQAWQSAQDIGDMYSYNSL